MAKVLEALIAKGRRVRRAAEQKEVAFGLADLTTHEELLERMVQKGGVKSLLLLLTKSNDKDAQRFSALALGNLASAAFNRTKVASEGTVPILINIMKDPDTDIICRQYCAMTLGNLAAEPENHLEIVKSNGIEALLAVLKTEDVDAGRYAAFGLANIGANANHRDRIVELGGVPSLISLACSEDINAQRQALAGLRSICISPEFRAVVVREGIMDPLVLMSRAEDINILREVASAINCLSSVEENKMEISDRAMSTVIGLMLSGDLIIERHAVCAAANLMEMQELHARLTEERGVAPIVAISASLDANSRGEACRCLANLSVNPDMHQLIIKEGSLPCLVASLSQNELNCQRYASLCLANLSTTVSAQVKVIQMGAIKPLIELGNNPNNQIEARRYAALALANLTATAANHMTIIEDGGLHSFFSLCNSPDLMSQYYVGCALANLSCSMANHYIIVEQGGLQALITLVSSKDPDVHQQAAAALRGLAVTTVNKMKIVQEGALSPLTLLLTSADVEILREVVACFCNLSISDENKLEIVKSGTISAFIALSQSSDMIVSSMSCATLANLAEIRSNQDHICKEGAVRPAISIMRSKFIEVQRESGRLLANLCASDSAGTMQIIEAGGHNLLISYLLSQDTACQRVGAMGICNLCTQQRFRKTLMECGVVEPLCSLARSEDIELEIQRYAILAIANLAAATEIHHMFVEGGMLALLISLSTANDAEVRQYAAFAVTKIAQNADVRNAITEEGGLEAVLYLARTDEIQIQKEVLPALCSLSFHDANKVSICRNGGLEPIVRAIRDGSAAVARLACCAIANLAEMVENFDRIFDSAAIPPLIKSLDEPSEELKREAARALGNLAANIELGDVILREGALPLLLPMLRSDDVHAQRMGAFALANLSSNIRNQTFMLNSGMFEILITEIAQALDIKSRSDYECTRYCLLVLSNLAVNSMNHEQLMKNALPVLAQFSKHRDIKCRQHAVFCIANLCSNKDNLEEIVATGCLRTIITYAFPSSDISSNVQFQAIAALRGIATHPVLRIQLVRDGALEPLIMCANSQSIEVQREAAATMCNIALAEENKVILARGGALPALISLAMSGDRQREIHSVAALANIAEMVEGRTQERMIEEGVLKPLLRLTESDDPLIRREVARSFALFASKRDSHAALVRVHAAVRIVGFLNDSDETCKRYGVLGIANLAVSRDTHQELFDVGAIAKLLDVVTNVHSDMATKRAAAFAFNNISSNPNNHTACERLGMIRSIILLLRESDKDTNLQATIAIRRLCESGKCRNQFLELQGISVLLELGLSEDIEVKREVAAALRNLSLSEHCKVALVKNGGLNLICEMMHSTDVEICHQSTGLIANLAEATENQGIMVDSGAIQHIKYVMRSKSIDIQREAARAMANISAEYSFAPAIVASGALLSLISAMSSPDFLCQRYAVMGVGNLATNPVNQKKIVQEGGLPVMMSMARFENGDLESQRYAAIALTNLSATKSNHSLMIDIGCLTLMKTLLQHQDIEIRNTAAFCLANFASNPNNHQLILREGIVDPMIRLLHNASADIMSQGISTVDELTKEITTERSKTEESKEASTKIIVSSDNPASTPASLISSHNKDAQLRATSFIRGLSTDADIRLDLIDLNILPPLLKLSKSDDIEMQMEALACLCNLSLCGCIGENPLAFLDAVTIQNLIAFLCSADSTYRLFGAVALGNIASSVDLHENLLDGGALAPLVQVANAADLETQRCIAYALCNIASDTRRRVDIVREGGLPSIISMACSDDLSDQLAALSTLRGIASQPENRRQVYLANIVEAIALGVAVDHIEIKCEVTALLCALSVNDDNKLEMVDRDEILENIVILLKSSTFDEITSNFDVHINNSIADVPKSYGDPRWLRPLMACIANFTERYECHERLRKYKIYSLVLLHINHDDVPMVREVTRTISNLSSVHENQQPIVACGGIQGLLHACTFDDAVTSRFAIIGLLNLATLLDNHHDLLRFNVCDKLTEFTAGTYRKWNHLDKLGNDIPSDDVSGVSITTSNSPKIGNNDGTVDDSISIANKGDETLNENALESPRSLRDAKFIDEYKYDKESRRYAILAVGNLAMSSFTHFKFMIDDCLFSLTSCLLSIDEETRFNSAFAINKLAMNEENLLILGDLKYKTIPNLIDILTKKDENYYSISQSVSALRHLAMLPQNRIIMLESQLLQPLSIIAQINRNIAVAINKKNTLAGTNTITDLINNAENRGIGITGVDSNPKGVGAGPGMLLNTSNIKTTLGNKPIPTSGSLPFDNLNSTGNSNSVDISNFIGQATVNTSALSIVPVSATSDSISIDTSIEYEKEILREVAALCCLLSLTEKLRYLIVGSNLLLPLIELSSLDDVEIARQACGAIANLAESKRTHKLLATVGKAMHVMVFAMKSKHLSIHREAARAVSNMLSSNAFHRLFLDDGGLSSLFRLCKSLDIETLYNCALIYRKLSPVLSNHDHIIGKGGLPALQNLTRTQELKVNRQAAAAIRDLASNPQYKTVLAEEGCLKRAIELASDYDIELRILGIGAIRHLSVHSRVKKVIVDLDGLAPIYLAIEDRQYQDLDLLRQCSSVLSYIAENYDNQITLIQNKVLPRLIHLAGIKDPEIQADVSKCFASLTSNLENSQGVFGLIEFKTLIMLTQSPEENCCRDALVSLGNLAINEKNQSMIYDIGGLVSIIACLHDYPPIDDSADRIENKLPITLFNSEASGILLKQRPESILKYACRCLYRLASSSSDIQRAILNTGNAISKLNYLCESNSVLVRKYAVMALCNVSTNESIQADLAKHGVLVPLINCLSDMEEVIAKYAAMALTNLSTEPTNQILIAKLNSIPVLIQLTSRIETEVSRYSAMCLCNLSCNRANRITIVQLDGLKAIIALIYTKSLESQRSSALALYNLSCAAANHVAMIKADIIPALVYLGKSIANDLECKRYSIMTLANLAANHETRFAATKSNGLQTAVSILKDPDVECRRYACIALGNMGNTTVTQEQLVVHGALPMLIQMVYDLNDVESQRQALLCLCNIAANELNHSTLVNKNIMHVLVGVFNSFTVPSLPPGVVADTVSAVSLLSPKHLAIDSIKGNSAVKTIGADGSINTYLTDDGSHDCKDYAAFTIANMCGNPDFLEHIGANGGIPPLIMLSRSNNVHSLCLGLSGLRRLANCEENWSRLIQAGILDSLASAGYSTEYEIQREVAACLCSLSLSEPHRIEIAYKCIQAMVNLSNLGDSDTIRQVVGALANLAEDVNTHEYIARSNGGKCLIALSRIDERSKFKRSTEENQEETTTFSSNMTLEIKREASRGIANILSSFRHQNTIIEDGIPGIISLAMCDDEECIYHAALCLRKLAPNLKSHATIIYNDGYKALFKLIKYSNNYNVQKQASSALRDLTSNPDYKLKCYEDGGVESLIALCKEPEETLQALALSALRHLSIAPELKVPIIQASKRKVMHRILKSIKNINEDIHLQAAGLLANLSEASENQVVMVDDGVIGGLVNLAFSSNPEVQQDIARACANLSSSEETHYKMYKQGVLPALVNLSASDNDLTQRYAAIGLRFLSSDPDIRVLIVRDGHVDAFVALATSQLLEYRRTAAMAFSSFSLHEANKPLMVRENGCIKALLDLARDQDLMTKRDATFALANLCESLELQTDLVREGSLLALMETALCDDARVQRDTARAFSILSQYEDIQSEMMKFVHINVVLGINTASATKTSTVAAEVANSSRTTSRPGTASSQNMFSTTDASDAIEVFNSNNNIPTTTLTATVLSRDVNINNVTGADLSQSGNMSSSSTSPLISCFTSILNLSKSLDIPCQRYSCLAICNLSSSSNPQHKIAIVEEYGSTNGLASTSSTGIGLGNTSTVKGSGSLVLKALIFLLKFPDVMIQKYTAMSVAGLALGNYGNNKTKICNEGCVKPLIDLIRLAADREVILAAVIALNCIVIGPELSTKAMLLYENSLIPILKLINDKRNPSNYGISIGLLDEKLTSGSYGGDEEDDMVVDIDMVSSVIYMLGSLSEHEDLKAKLVEFNSIEMVVKQYNNTDKYSGMMLKATTSSSKKGDASASNTSHNSILSSTSTMIDIKRAIGYFFAGLCEQVEYHDLLYQQGAFQVIISLASLEDIECQEYSAFCLAHLASNKDFQVILVNMNVVKPLVVMLSSDAEPKHYAGLALLKLADNFENHIKIAEAGGIQALLRLGRSKTNDEQLQYKAALSVGQLASNAVRLMPNLTMSSSKSQILNNPSHTSPNIGNQGADSGLARGGTNNAIGHGVRMLNRLRRQSQELHSQSMPLPSSNSTGAELVNTYLNGQGRNNLKLDDDDALRLAEMRHSGRDRNRSRLVPNVTNDAGGIHRVIISSSVEELPQVSQFVNASKLHEK